MKIISSLFMFVLISFSSVYSLEIESDEYYVTTDIAEGIAVTAKELIHIQQDYDDVSIVSRTPRPDKLYNNYGFLEYKLKSLHAIVVELNGLFLTHIKGSNGHDPFNMYLTENITSLSASSELVEKDNGKETVYKIDNILSRLSYEKETGYYLYSSDLPWATNLLKDYNPVISIEVKESISSFYLLNGYVDFYKQSLYRNNARAKKIQVFDKETTSIVGEYSLIDKVIYQLIMLPKSVKNFEIRIIENYPGNKYSDICISSIYLNKTTDKLLSGNYGISFYNELKKEKKF